MFLINLLEAVIPFMGLTMFSSALATLRNILLAKGQKKAAYFAIFFDALAFSTIMKKISGGDGLIFGVAYALGKVLGAMIGNKIEEIMALGILEVDVSVNHFEKMVEIADELRDLGYAVETFSVYGYGGKKRYKINILISRREVPILERVLKSKGYEEPTMVVRGVSNVSGKITVNSEVGGI